MRTHTNATIKQAIAGKLRRHFSKELEEATTEQIYQACALIIRDALSENLIRAQNEIGRRGEKQVHYICVEFLMGRSLLNNAYNLGYLSQMREALKEINIDISDLFEQEQDPGLGNGGLGRLAACFMDAMATTGVRASGYSIRYQHGIFKQKIVQGNQVELPDSWLSSGEVWHIPVMDDVREVKIGGYIEEKWENGKLTCDYKDYITILATPYDMPVSGYNTDNVSRLRLWQAKSPVALDMHLFSRGKYLKAIEEHSMAEVISMVLYPEDNHIEGKSLRLKQQYFLVSATVQDIVQKHKERYKTVDNFAAKNVLHINDTHPALVIPELMRIFLDEEGMIWDEAWNIVTQSVAYTNHTVLPEALECWSCDLVKMLLPRIFNIIHEINERYCKGLWAYYPGDFQKISKCAIIGDGVIRMAHLAIAGSFSVNGVSELHSDILKTRLFKDFYKVTPAKFKNVTNGIAHRRWLCEANPTLSEFISEIIGNGYKTRPSELRVLEKYSNDKSVHSKLSDIKKYNKNRLAKYILDTTGIVVDCDSIFDVQVKRLHEYKRQLMNVMHIIHLYFEIKDNPNKDFVPRTFIFGAKASPGYHVAKRIIHLIHSVADMVNTDADIKDKIKVVFIEDYKVSLAEIIIPATELSEQISIAGKEASGTGNMKFMINGAITMGTLDGANVEICDAVGEDNIFIFGMKAHEVEDLIAQGNYNPMRIYHSNPKVTRVLDKMRDGFNNGSNYTDIVNLLLYGNGGMPDQYMLLADFDSYINAQERASEMYKRVNNWNVMSLKNIANSGRFAADRSIAEYSSHIWNVHSNFKF